LPTLPQNLEILYCERNELTSLPTLPQNLQKLYCFHNPIYEIVNNDNFIKIKQNIQILNNVCHLYYCLKFKKQFRKWLWEKVRELNAKKMYSPNYLIENTEKTPSIINGLVENTYDVDAIYKLVCNNDNLIKWDKNKSVLIDNNNVCLFY
jgi:hypothetical protein